MVAGSVAVEEKLNPVHKYEEKTAMIQIVLLDRSLGIMAILVGILLAMLCLGVPLTKYKGHWSQWSMSSRTCFLLFFASVVGFTIIALQWLVWNATCPDFIM